MQDGGESPARHVVRQQHHLQNENEKQTNVSLSLYLAWLEAGSHKEQQVGMTQPRDHFQLAPKARHRLGRRQGSLKKEAHLDRENESHHNKQQRCLELLGGDGLAAQSGQKDLSEGALAQQALELHLAARHLPRSLLLLSRGRVLTLLQQRNEKENTTNEQGKKNLLLLLFEKLRGFA